MGGRTRAVCVPGNGDHADRPEFRQPGKDFPVDGGVAIGLEHGLFKSDGALDDGLIVLGEVAVGGGSEAGFVTVVAVIGATHLSLGAMSPSQAQPAACCPAIAEAAAAGNQSPVRQHRSAPLIATTLRPSTT